MEGDTAFGGSKGIGLGSFEGAFGGGFTSTASSSNSGGNVSGPSIQFGAGSRGAGMGTVPLLIGAAIIAAVIYKVS